MCLNLAKKILLNYTMNYSFIPQKIMKSQPVYSVNQICPKCQSNNSFPVTNMVGSIRYCNNCKNTFEPQISGYKNVLVETDYDGVH